MLKNYSFIAKLLVMTMLVSIIIFPLAAFADVDYKNTENPIVKEWLEKDLIKGYEDGNLRLERSVSRIEFIKMINSCKGFTKLTDINFKDVDGTEWYYNEARKAVAAGYLIGYEDNTLRPNKLVTAEELCVYICRVTNLDGNELGANRYVNSNQIPKWAKASVGAVAEKGYIDILGNNRFPSGKTISRLDAITILDLVMKDKEETKESKPSSTSGNNHHRTKHVEDVEISTSSAIIAVGNTLPLLANVTPSNADNKNVEWSSSNTTVASITADGIVCAKSTGSAIITVETEDRGYTDSCNITVVDKDKYVYDVININGNNFEVSSIDDFMKGTFNNIGLVSEVGDGAITINKVDGKYPNDGYYISPIFDVENFEYMVASWNSDTPEGTYVEIQAKALVNHYDESNQPVQDWTDWLSWGKYSPHLNRASESTNDKLAETSIDELIIKGNKGETACKVQMRAILHTDNQEVAPVLRLMHGSLKNTLDGQKIEYIIRDKSSQSCYKTIETPRYSQSVRDPSISGKICSPTCVTMLVNRFRINDGDYELLPEEVAQNNYDFNYGFGNWAFSVATAATYGYKTHVEYTTLDGIKNEIANGYPVALSVKYSNSEKGSYPYLEGAAGNTGGHLITVIGFTMKDGVEYAISNDPYAPGGNDTVYREYKVEQLMKAWSNGVAYIVHDKEEGAGLYPTKRVEASLTPSDSKGEYNVIYNDSIFEVDGFDGNIMYTVDNDKTFFYFLNIEDKNTLDIDYEAITNPNFKLYIITDHGKVYVAKPDEKVLGQKKIVIEKDLALKVGESYTITAQKFPEESFEGELKWLSSDEDVATVDQNGKVTAVSKGICTIKVMSADETASSECLVIVTDSLEVEGSITSVSSADDFNKGIKQDVEVVEDIGDGAIRLVNENNEYVEEGYFYSQVFDVSNFEYMLASWNADTPKDTYIEIKARTLVNHKDKLDQDTKTWSEWMSWGTCGTFGPKRSDNTESLLSMMDADVLTIKGSAGETASKVQFMAVLHTNDTSVTPVIRHITGSIKNTMDDKKIEYVITDPNENVNNDNIIENVPLYCKSTVYNNNSKYDMASSIASLVNYQIGDKTDYILPEEIAQNNYVSNDGGFRNWSFNASMAGDWGYYSRAEYSCLNAIKNEIANGYPVAAKINGNFSVITGFKTIDNVEYALISDYPNNEDGLSFVTKAVADIDWEDIVTFIVHGKENGAGTSPVSRIQSKIVPTDTDNEYKITYNNGESVFDIDGFGGNIVYTSLEDDKYKFIKDQSKSTITLTSDEYNSSNLRVYIVTDKGYVYDATK